jgi:hypothetical protein
MTRILENEEMEDLIYKLSDGNCSCRQHTLYTYRVVTKLEELVKFNRMEYTGVHSCRTCSGIFTDGHYLGSSTNPNYQKIVRHYPEALQLTSIEQFNSCQELDITEYRKVNQKYVSDKKTFNKALGGGRALSPALRKCAECQGSLMSHKKDCGQSLNPITPKNCSLHGLTLFQGDSCCKCVTKRAFKQENCSICNQTTWHSRKSCLNCLARARITINHCAIHGETKFQVERCIKCQYGASTELKYCSSCQQNKLHHNGHCLSCRTQALVTVKKCSKHGEVKFMGDSCCTCVPNDALKVCLCSDCNKETTHSGGRCLSCANRGVVTLKFCIKHGSSKFTGDSCCNCLSEARLMAKFCSQGNKETAHNREHCISCSSQKGFYQSNCPKHGRGKFRKNKCCRCIAQKAHQIELLLN